VALNENLEAFGTLFLDDGESDYSFQNGIYLELQFHFYGGERLDINVVHNKFTPAGNLTFNTIDIYGLHRHPSDVIVDGSHIKSASQISNIIRLSGFQLDVTNNHTITLEMDKR
uniref:Uncharacterized protein n=2 Tax=Magallana TaxID=2171616 RepID=A0A8W8IYD0_MAGGI